VIEPSPDERKSWKKEGERQWRGRGFSLVKKGGIFVADYYMVINLISRLGIFGWARNKCYFLEIIIMYLNVNLLFRNSENSYYFTILY
jgi:hypothetical protein